MKASVTSILTLAIATMATHAATTFFEDFDGSTSIPSGWTINNNIAIWDDPSYATSGTNSLTIVEARNSNYVTTPVFDFTGATEATISFNWVTGPNSGAFGRFTQIQYTSNGADYILVAQIALPANTPQTTPALFSATIDTGGGYAFTSNSAFRIVGDNDGGGGGAPLAMDDFSVTSNAVPEPSAVLLGSIAGLLLLRRRRH